MSVNPAGKQGHSLVPVPGLRLRVVNGNIAKVGRFDQLGQYVVAVVGGVGAEVGHRAVVVGEADHAEVFDPHALIFASGGK